jgi:hypothetical protein
MKERYKGHSSRARRRALFRMLISGRLSVRHLVSHVFPFAERAEVLPRELVMLGNLLPQTYAVSAARKALLKGVAFSDVAGELFTLTLQAAVLIPVGAALLAYSLSLERKRATMY